MFKLLLNLESESPTLHLSSFLNCNQM